MAIVITAVVLWILPKFFLVNVKPGDVGVRQSNMSGVFEEDLKPGWHWKIPGLHKVIILPRTMYFLDYVKEGAGPLQIRTKDNNIVHLDVTVPIRVKREKAYELVKMGNHVKDSDGRYRFQRLAQETTVSVLREQLAELDSVGFYSTERRLDASDKMLAVLNEALAPLYVEAETVLIRAVAFRAEYENQLQQIQLNEQNKLLDASRQHVAEKQQELDIYVQGTAAQRAAREQDWLKRQADLERAYQVGFIDSKGDDTPGAARGVMVALAEEQKLALKTKAGEIFGLNADDLDDAYLLGIQNIVAETSEYDKRVRAEADGINSRLSAEGDAMIAKVQGEYETKVNGLLNSPAGRAYVAWKSAANITFAKTLTFNSSDGIPSVLRLRRFAQQFMNQ
jgi:hypothetical protein